MKTFTVLLLFILSITFLTFCNAQTTILYGMTTLGGTLDSGTIFTFNPSTNKENVVWNFGMGTDGRSPVGNLVYTSSNGLFYGMTYNGGNIEDGAAGTIITFNPTTNKENVVWNFGNGTDGANPNGNLVYNSNNELFYGMTWGGGSNTSSNGTIISFNPSNNQEKVLWNFGYGTDAGSPVGSLVYDTSNGLLYGMTHIDIPNSLGAIISFNPSNDSEKVVWSFGSHPLDGSLPWGSLIYDAGNGLFYGMTTYGGSDTSFHHGTGTIISFNPINNSENVVWNFGYDTDGILPHGSLVYDAKNGLFYGITELGGSYNAGTIISFNPANDSEKVVWSFGNGIDGANPYGDLTYDASDGLFFGLTYNGGSDSVGAIFSFNPANDSEKLVWSFRGGVDGAQPLGSLLLYSGPTGINSISNPSTSTSIYPNPSSGTFNITGMKNGQIIELYNYLGQLVTKMVVDNVNQQQDISSQPNGLYLMRILNADGSIAGQKEIVKAN